MTLRSLTTALAVASLLAAQAAAHEFTLGALTIGHPYALETGPASATAAGYLSVTNAGDQPERLVGVETGFPRTELHLTETDAAGVARMRHVEGLEIAPGETLTLEPRGAHVMFLGLDAPLAAGEEIPATLVFETAGRIEVVFNVEARGDEQDPGAHEGH